MKKRILAVLIVLAMTVCFTACNQENNKEESSVTSNTSETESKASDSDVSSGEKQDESSYDLGDYIDQNIKNTKSYKKMMTASNGDVIILATENYISEYYKFENGEIGVIDKSLEKDNGYTYLKYTDGNKMYTVDVNGKLYAETDISEDNSSDKEKFLTDLVNYLYYGLTYLGEKDGVEIYNVPSSDRGETEDDETDGTDENVSTEEVPENTTATSAKAETETKTTDDVSVDSSEVITTIGASSGTDTSVVASTDTSVAASTGEASSEPDDLKRYIKVTDTGIMLYDYVNGEKQSIIDVTIRKITDEDMKQFTIEGCEKYEESSSDEVSYNVEDLPDIPDFDASDESEETSVSVAEVEEVSKESDAGVVSKE